MKQLIIIKTTEGDGEATKEKQSDEWLISHPFGDARFYGSVPEVKKFISKTIGNDLVSAELLDQEIK